MATAAPERIPARSEIPADQTWDLEYLYKSPPDWDADFARLDELVQPILALRGELSTAESALALFEAEDALGRLLEKLYAYAHHREDEDTGNEANQARTARIASKYSQIAAATAWTTPELLANDASVLEAWRDDARLATYRFTLVKLLRQKAHTLSEAEETLLSAAAEVFRVPSEAFSMLTNADMEFPDAVDSSGKPHPLSNGRYGSLLENKDRALRRDAFGKLYANYQAHKNTLATTIKGAVKHHNFNARARKFESALHASLHPDNVPKAVFDALVAAVRKGLPILHDYLALRAEVLGLDDLDMWDLHTPIVPDFDRRIPWEEARQWITEACEPLGPEYAAGLREAFEDRWIDVLENKGKRSGAYSGGCYDSKPYILLNHTGTLDSVFTLAHELGHSLHTWLAKRNNPYRTADNTIFVAEIASTTNEGLLLDHLLRNTDDKRFRAYLLNQLCDNFRGTVYRQVMFAEFERLIHDMDASGDPLTNDSLSKAYYALNEEWHGPAIKADPRIASEWSRIPHFYYNFYVYKYATGFCAAQVFSKAVREDEAKRDAYLGMLKAGGSADPLDLVKGAGVDLSSVAVLESALETFRQSVDELRGLLKG